MEEYQVLFKSEMVRKILANQKTNTRRVVKFPHAKSLMAQLFEHQSATVVHDMPLGGWVFWSGSISKEESDRLYANSSDGLRCPYGETGDRLWVRETWRCEELEDGLDGIRYKADNAFCPIENTRKASDAWIDARRDDSKWRPSIFMPRWASRITLSVTSSTPERLLDISEDDAISEGINLIDHNCYENYMVDSDWTYNGRNYRGCHMVEDPIGSYMSLWDSINAERGYGHQVNPWVWNVKFSVVQP